MSEQGVDGAGEGPEQLEVIVQRFAELRALPIKLLERCERTQGHAYSEELRAWLRLFEKYEMEVCDPARAELRAPMANATFRQLVEIQGASFIADFIGFLCACTVVVQQDAMSYLASWHGTAEGRSKIYYFHPHDWGLWPTEGSLLARLYKLLQEEEQELYEEDASIEAAVLLLERAARTETLPVPVDPARLFPRVDWLTHALLGVGRDFSAELARASTLEDWANEKADLEKHPHLATYWLWHHYLFDNLEELDELLERTAGVDNTVFADARQLVVGLLDGKPTKLGDRTAVGFAELREEIERLAPLDRFATGSIKRRRGRREAESERPDEAEAMAALLAQREKEPAVDEALRLLEHLSRGGANRPEPTDTVPLDADQAMDRLAALVDRRFAPVIDARLEKAALFADTHREASWGLLLAAAATAEDLAEFETLLERVGTTNFGPRRMTELYRAYSRFSERRAVEVLAYGARAWLDEVDDWIRMTPAEPVLRLIERDVLEAHEVMAAVLERASFTGANWEIAVQVACAAGDLRSKRAVRGLKRAVRHHLGRVEDGTRTRVVQALFLAAGADARPFLEEQVQKKLAAIRYSEAADVPILERDLACLLAGLLPAAPEDDLVIRRASALLAGFSETLESKAPRLVVESTVAALDAIVAGARLGEVRALAPALNRLVAVTPGSRATTRRVEGLQARVLEVARELSS